MIRFRETRGRLHGIRIARTAPTVSHLFFADDSILFARATCQQSNEIVHILREYGAASGQQVNLSKSELSFSKNVVAERRQEIQEVMGIREVEKHEKYLGLPTMVGRSKKLIFNQIKERILKKVRSWNSKSLSRAGKEVLIKSIAQTIPNYTMSFFLLPSSLCKELEQILCNYWWGDTTEGSKMHWLRWKRMCRPKNMGGMGFRDIEKFNLALLAKQGWRIIQDPFSLTAKLFKAKYFPHEVFMEAQVGRNPSYTWSICSGRDILKQGLRWSVGNGNSIDIWRDKWIPRPGSFMVVRTEIALSSTRLIDFIDWNIGRWKVEQVREVFAPCDTDLILGMKLIDPLIQDEQVWHFSKDRVFTVRSAYNLMVRNNTKRLTTGESSSKSGVVNGRIFGRSMLPHVFDRSYGGPARRFFPQNSIFGGEGSRRKTSASFVDSRKPRWKRPPPEFIKINCDASVSAKFGNGIGFVARNSDGLPLFMGTRVTSPSPDADVEEAESIWWALKCCRERGLRKVCVESDSLSVISKIQKGTGGKGALGWLLEQIKRLRSHFAVCRWSHVKREGNKPAHLLAEIKPSFEFCTDYYQLFSQELNVLLRDDLT